MNGRVIKLSFSGKGAASHSGAPQVISGYWGRSEVQQSSRTSHEHVVVVDVWAGLGFLRWFVTFALFDVWSEEIASRRYLTLSAVIGPADITLLCLQLITETCLKLLAPQIPQTERSEARWVLGPDSGTTRVLKWDQCYLREKMTQLHGLEWNNGTKTES